MIMLFSANILRTHVISSQKNLRTCRIIRKSQIDLSAHSTLTLVYIANRDPDIFPPKIPAKDLQGGFELVFSRLRLNQAKSKETADVHVWMETDVTILPYRQFLSSGPQQNAVSHGPLFIVDAPGIRRCL